MTIASAFNDIAVAQGGTAAKSGAITAAIDALNDALAGSDQPQAKTIEQAVRLLGEHIGGGGASLGRLAIVGVTDGDSNPLTALYNVLIGESAASKSVAPEAFLAAAGSTVSIEVPSVGGDAPTGDETVEATLIDGEPAAFTDFTKSLKDEALCIEFTMPATTAEEALLIFAVTEGK